MTATHRGHGQSIGKGMRLDLMMAEFLGKETGYCKGRGGCMHIADFSVGQPRGERDRRRRHPDRRRLRAEPETAADAVHHGVLLR